MNRFNKNLGFNLGLIVLGAAFLAGLVMAYLAYSGGVDTLRELGDKTRAEALLLNGHAFSPGEALVSLNEDNVKTAQNDVTELAAHREKLNALIAGNKDMALLGKPSANSAELSAVLRESVDGWRKQAADQGVKFTPNEPTAFGFHRYIHNQGTSPKRDFQKVDQQRLIIDFLVRQLIESRPAGSPLLIESIDREPVETYIVIPEGRPGAGTFGPDSEAPRNEADEFAPTRTFARSGLVETLSFRVRFVGYTPTLRTFVNKIRNSGRPLAVTTIDVGTTTKEVEKLLSAPVALVPSTGAPAGAAAGPSPVVVGTPVLSFFDQAPAASGANAAGNGASSEDKRVQVVQRKLSTFVVQVDYLSIPAEKPAAEGEPKK